MQKHNIETEVIHSRCSWDVSFLIRLIERCRQLNIDIIHAHLFVVNLYRAIVGSILRIPVIATFHNELSILEDSKILVAYKNYIIHNLVTRVASVVGYMKGDYIYKGKFRTEKLLTPYNGIETGDEPGNLEISALRKDQGLKNGELVAGNVANLRYTKGHPHLVKAAGQIYKSWPKIKV